MGLVVFFQKNGSLMFPDKSLSIHSTVTILSYKWIKENQINHLSMLYITRVQFFSILYKVKLTLVSVSTSWRIFSLSSSLILESSENDTWPFFLLSMTWSEASSSWNLFLPFTVGCGFSGWNHTSSLCTMQFIHKYSTSLLILIESKFRL